MGLSGAGAGAAAGLEAVLERRLKEVIRQQQEQQHAQQLALQTRQVEGVEADRAANREGQRRLIDLAELKRVDDQSRDATDRNIGLDAANVMGMPGMSRGAQANELQQSVLRNPNASSSPGMLKIIEGLTRVEKPERDPIADYKSKKELDRQYDRPVAGPKPERDPIADYKAKLELDRQYKQPGTGGVDPVAEAQDTAREAKRIADSLLKHPGLSGAFGVVDARLPTVRQATADAEVLRDSLTSLLTLENMGKMKGVLSDSDMKVLRQASSTIAAPMSDSAARAELTRLSQVMEKVAGAAPPLAPGTTVNVPGGGSVDRVAELLKKYGGK